jgi:hypothetical protein
MRRNRQHTGWVLLDNPGGHPCLNPVISMFHIM